MQWFGCCIKLFCGKVEIFHFKLTVFIIITTTTYMSSGKLSGMFLLLQSSNVIISPWFLPANNKKAHYCFMLLTDFWVHFLDFLLLLTVNQVMFNSIIVHLHYWILVSEVKAQLQMKTRNNIFWKLVPLICEKKVLNDLCKCKFVLKITKRISLLVIRRDC